MLEYDIDEAQSLLTDNRTNAIKSLEDVKEQLGNEIFNLSKLVQMPSLHKRKWDGLCCRI